jgi:MFS family permease
MQHPYIRLLRIPGVPRLLLATFAGALPLGMLNLAILLLVRAATGSLGEAGLMAGALTAGNAVGITVQGRLLDRWGQAPVLLSTGPVSAAALVLLVVAAHGATAAALGAVAVLAGAATPATISSMRALWPSLVEEPELRTSAYALLALMFTIAVVLGPLIVSGIVLLSGPAPAVLVAAIFTVGSAAMFASAPASRRWRSSAPNRGWHPRALATPGSRTLIGAGLLGGIAGGIGSVAVSALALAAHAAAISGVLLSLASIGDGVVGLVYGGRAWRMPARLRLPLIQACQAAITAVEALARSPLQLAPLQVLGGAANAPSGITISALLDVVAPEGALTETYTVLVGVGLLGSSIGSALGGHIVDVGGPSAAFALSALGAAMVALWTAARRRTLEPA